MGSRNKKKRNKVYTGKDAAVTRPTVVRMAAANRGPLKQWWFEKKRLAKPILIAAGVATLVIWLLIELVRVLM